MEPMSNKTAVATPPTPAEAFFEPWEEKITGWESANELIERVIGKAGKKRELAWRGVSNASYSLHSSLYRRLRDKLGHAPDESEVSAMEKKILDAARKHWRFDNLSALEIMAHIQHYGGPTRLIDVSLNPMIALWFAIEKGYNQDGSEKPDVDGRIYVFDVTGRSISLDSQWGGYELPWDPYPSDNWRKGLPLLWRPPSYNERIPAQNSAFLIGGVPQLYSGGNAYYRKAPGDGVSSGTWNIDEIRAVTSVTLRMHSLKSRIEGGSTPTFTLRITAEAKKEIRARLERSYGYSSASIYPDLFGLAIHGVKGLL